MNISSKSSLAFILLVGISFLLNGCKKILEDKPYSPVITETQSQSRNPDVNCDLTTTICLDCPLQDEIDNTSTDYPTVLGDVINNPYSIPNMTAAFNNIYSANQSAVVTTHLYVKFKPLNTAELSALEALDLDLFDYPLDREVIEDGDYWPTAYEGLGSGELPWLYTVVESNFVFPSGIQKEILAPLHIPADHAVLEDEAFYITGNSVCDSIEYTQVRAEKIDYYRLHPIDECDWGGLEGCTGGCNSGCGGTTGGNSTLKPKGQISFKTYSVNPGGRVSATAPLKYARVVARRFLKIDKTYTDQNGNFQLSKRFPRKVTIIVKFKASTGHGQHSVRTNYIVAGIWRSMFPIKKNIGTYRGNNLTNLRYEFQKGSNSTQVKTRKWLAAVIMNTTEEARLLMGENNMVSLPNDLRLYLYAPEEQLVNNAQYDFTRRSNVPYLNQDREIFWDIVNYTFAIAATAVTLGILTVATAVAPIVIVSLGGTAISFALIPRHPDVYFYFRTSDINSLTATKVSMSAGQQLGLVYLYKLYDISPFTRQDRASYLESLNYSVNEHSFDTYAPFGDGVPAYNTNFNYYPGLVGLWQQYAQHFGHVVTDRIYGIGADEFQLQGKNWQSDFVKSSNLKYLEEFEPSIGPPADYFNWIPVGLVNDLMDNSPDPFGSTVVDNVSGFSYLDLQNALYYKPTSLPEFKDRLKDIKPAQSVQIDQLFASYGY